MYYPLINYVVFVFFDRAINVVYHATKSTINPENLLDDHIFFSGGFSYKPVLFFGGGLELQTSMCIQFYACW
jgi:hypothetical protein